MRFIDVIAAVLVAAIWGGNFVASKFTMTHLPPFLLTAVRFMVVAALLIPFFPAPKGKFREMLWLSFTLGTLHFALGIASMWYGLDASKTVIFIQLGVPFSALLATYFLGDTLGWKRTFGMVLSFMGIIVMTGAPNVMQNQLGFFIVITSAFFWAVANIITKKMGEVHSMTMVGWMSLLSAPQLLVISYFVEDRQWELLMTMTPTAIYGISYSILLSSIAAYGLWYYLLKRYAVNQVTPFTLLAPFFGSSAAIAAFNEPLNWETLLGGLITMAGVAIITIRRPKVALQGK